jgi:hypothetical protein
MSESNKKVNNCNFHNFEKNKYFYGKLMTVRDFEAEQEYFDGKRYLINRLLHGTGIVCGFEKVEVLIKENEPLKINFVDGGMALTCCGHEIVVPSGTQKRILDEKGELVIYKKDERIPHLSKFPYLYLKYKFHDSGYVPVASNSSNCEEKCCPSRVVDDFDILTSDNPPSSGIGCKHDLSISKWLSNLEEKHKACPQCGEYQADMVFLGNVDISDNLVKQNEPERYRILFRQKDLYQILKCHAKDYEDHVDNFKSHVNNISNPHKVTAFQVGALTSINSVSKPGGNIELVKSNSISIDCEDASSSIIIGETHSEKTDNPHNVTAAQTGAPVSVGGVSNPGGDIKLIQNGSLVIIPDDRNNSITIGETHSSRMDNPHHVTAGVIGALVSVNGIRDPGGNIDLVEGTNIKITSQFGSIKFDCTLGLEILPSETVIKSIGPQNLVGSSTMYARADHVHMLEDNSVDHNKLSAGIQEQLGFLSSYVRERALKCSASSFKKIAEDFKNDRAFDISLNFKKAIGKKLYEKEKDFVKFMDSMQGQIKEFAEEIRELAEEGGFTDFENSLEALQKTIPEGIPLKIATLQDEVCFYALELKLTVNNPMYKALNCTALNFRKVAELFKNETARRISFNFEKAVESRVYEDRDRFVTFMGENLELLRALSKELKIKAAESSLNDYSFSIEELADTIDLNDVLNIAEKQQEICSYAQKLDLSDDPSNNPMYMALKRGAASYREVSTKLLSDIADMISLDFERAVNKRLYDSENEFIEFMDEEIDQLKGVHDEIKDLSIEEELTNYNAVVNELENAIKSKNALEIAEKLRQLCFQAEKLDPSTPMYRALKCTIINFAEAADLFESKTAKTISVNFELALNRKFYEDDDVFIKHIEENFELFETFAEEIVNLATKETLTNYISSVQELSDALGSGEALKIATTQEEVCSTARELHLNLNIA